MTKKTLQELKDERKALDKKINKLNVLIHKATFKTYDEFAKIKKDVPVPIGVGMDVVTQPETFLRLQLQSDYVDNVPLDLTAIVDAVRKHFSLADDKIHLLITSDEEYYSSYSEKTVYVELKFKLGSGTSDSIKELNELVAERNTLDAERKDIDKQIAKLNAAERRKKEKARKAEEAAKVEAMERDLLSKLAKKYPDLLDKG